MILFYRDSKENRLVVVQMDSYSCTLQHTATGDVDGFILILTACNTLYCNTLQTLQHTATHCNTLQHTATHCNTLQLAVYMASYQCTLQRTATHCSWFVHIDSYHALHDALQCVAVCCRTLQRVAVCCSALHLCRYCNRFMSDAQDKLVYILQFMHKTVMCHVLYIYKYIYVTIFYKVLFPYLSTFVSRDIVHSYIIRIQRDMERALYLCFETHGTISAPSIYLYFHPSTHSTFVPRYLVLYLHLHLHLPYIYNSTLPSIYIFTFAYLSTFVLRHMALYLHLAYIYISFHTFPYLYSALSIYIVFVVLFT